MPCTPSVGGLRLATIDLASGHAAAGHNVVCANRTPLALLKRERIGRLNFSSWGSGWESCDNSNEKADDEGELHIERRLSRAKG
jgi:hypothetical protein